MIYLDHNATTPPAPEVLAEYTRCATTAPGNPSSLHAAGRAAKAELDRARATIASFIGAHPDEVVFTSGGTESNNTAIHSALRAAAGRRHIVSSAVEHPAVIELLKTYAGNGWSVSLVPPDHHGCIRAATIRRYIRPDTALVCVMAANNETGAINEVDAIGQIARQHNAAYLVDATQAMGKIPISLRNSGATYLTASAHKLHGPRGVGLLAVARNAPFAPSLVGGGQEDSRRAGTENIPAIVGFAQAVRLCLDPKAIEATRQIRDMRDRLQNWILRRFAPSVLCISATGPRLWNTLCACFRNIPNRSLQAFLDRAGIAVGVGSACSCLRNPKPSPTLEAMGIPPEYSSGAVRFSFGRYQAPVMGGDPGLIDRICYALEQWLAQAQPARPTRALPLHSA